MNRRTFFTGAGLTLSIPLVGCIANSTRLGDTGDDGGSEDSNIPDSPSDFPVDTGDLGELDPENTSKQVDVGSRAEVDDAYRPHDVRIWNEANEPEIVLRIIEYPVKSVVHHETYEIPGDTELAVSLLEPSEYLIEARVPGTEKQQTLRVPCDFFDCNASTIHISISDDGQIQSVASSQLVACPSADC